MTGRTPRLTDKALAEKVCHLWANNEMVQIVAGYYAARDELERRHGRRGARKIINDEIERRNKTKPK
jgi:hypothetical protein